MFWDFLDTLRTRRHLVTWGIDWKKYRSNKKKKKNQILEFNAETIWELDIAHFPEPHCQIHLEHEQTKALRRDQHARKRAKRGEGNPYLSRLMHRSVSPVARFQQIASKIHQSWNFRRRGRNRINKYVKVRYLLRRKNLKSAGCGLFWNALKQDRNNGNH